MTSKSDKQSKSSVLAELNSDSAKSEQERQKKDGSTVLSELNDDKGKNTSASD